MENNFRKVLKELRTGKGLSQEELARELSVQRYYISNLEQGRTEPDINMLIKLSQYFKVTVDYLVGIENS